MCAAGLCHLSLGVASSHVSDLPCARATSREILLEHECRAAHNIRRLKIGRHQHVSRTVDCEYDAVGAGLASELFKELSCLDVIVRSLFFICVRCCVCICI